MTIVLSTQYPGKADAPSAGYPQGSFKNVTAPGAGDGTPWEKVWVNDWAGFFQRLVSEAGITPSGSPDTILAGDNWDALEKLFQRGIPYVDSGTAGAHAVVSALGGDPSALYDGLTIQYAVNTLNTAAVTVNLNAIGAKALELPGGVALTGGELNAGLNITARYDIGDDKFYIISGIPNIIKTIDGLVLSNNTVDVAKDIDVSTGSAVDSLGHTIMKSTAVIVKQLDAAWAAGTNAGGLFSGSVAADTLYYFYMIQKDTDNSVDFGFDTSPVGANIPAGYTKYRKLGSILTDSSSNIELFTDYELAGGSIRRDWKKHYADISFTGATTRQTGTMTAPPNSIAMITARISTVSSSDAWVRSVNFTDVVPSASTFDLKTTTGATAVVAHLQIQLDSSSQLAHRMNVSGATLVLLTYGYIDMRIS